MAFGARPFGTRAFGDSTTYAAAGTAGTFQYGTVLFTGVANAVFTSTAPQRGAVLFQGVGSITFGNPIVQQSGVIKFQSFGRITFNVPRVRVVDPSVGPEPYRIIVSDVSGYRYGELDKARIEDATWVLNGIGSLRFRVSVEDAKGLLIDTPKREVQLYRGTQKLWEGPVVRKRSNKSEIEVQAQDLNWYFTKRFIGKANRTNFMEPNSGFELGINGWDIMFNPIATTAQAFPRSVEVVKNNRFTGDRSVKLVHAQVNPATFVRKAIYWQVPSGEPDGTLWTVSCWFYIESWTGPALQGAGIRLNRYSTTQTILIYTPVYGTTIPYPKPLGHGEISFDKDTTRGQWVRAEIPLLQPAVAGTTELITVSLHGIQGTIYYDEVALTRNEALRFNNIDQALIVKGLVEHAQDPAFGKSDLGITTDCQLTGVKRTRAYEHSEHQMVNDILTEFPSLHNGLDTSIEIGDNGIRRYTTHFHFKATPRNAIVLEYGKNLSDFSVVEDGEIVANSVVVLGEGEGSDREEGGFSDPESLDGLVLEKVYNATPGAPIQTLQDQAKRGVERFKTPIVIPEIITNDPDLVGVLSTGDIIRVKIVKGDINYDDMCRIIMITLRPNTNELALQINPLTEELYNLA
jgi:hypothetical protein